MDDIITYEFAIYYLPTPRADPLAELESLLQGPLPFFTQVEQITGEETVPSLAARLDTEPRKSYAPPDMEYLQYFGRGMSREQAESLQQCEAVVILHFVYANSHVYDGLRAALELTHALATATGGLLWDEETREVFAPAAWQKRLENWHEGFPDVSQHTVIHAYQTDELVRAITLGMAKFGLPDLVVEEFSWSMQRSMGHVVNLLAQAFVEGAELQQTGEFDLDLRAIKHSAVREQHLATLKPNATGVASLGLMVGTHEDGDPQNRLIEITFNRGAGPDRHARQVQIVGQALGWEDEIVQVKHDEEISRASQRARQQLPALRDALNRGLDPGEFIQVKAPFDGPDDAREWMWVEVISWEGDKIVGLLKNEPFSIPTLHAGQRVDVSESEVFDYIRRYPDGRMEGNETGSIIEKSMK